MRKAAKPRILVSERSKWVTLTPPRVLSLHETNVDTVRFLRAIYDQAVFLQKRCKVDLSRLEGISMGAAVALVAEMNRAEIVRPGNVKGILPRKRALRAILASVGFIASTTTGIGTYDEAPGGQFLKIRSGTAEDAKNTGFLDAYLERIFPDEILSPQVRGRLKGAVTEALLNVVDHAYNPDVVVDHICPERRWWICGSAHPEEGCYFVVCDLGVGIPATVPVTKAPAVVQAFNALQVEERKLDHNLIRVAVSQPMSRTGLQGRGRGLPEMRRLIDRVGDGMLWITSGRGHYIYARGEAERDGGFGMNQAIHGTLVVWQLKVSEALNEPGGTDG